MAALPLVGSSKLSLLTVYCLVFVATRYISSIKCSPVPQDAGGFQKPHFQVTKNFSDSSILSVTRELERSVTIGLSVVIYFNFLGNHLTSLRVLTCFDISASFKVKLCFI